ncbi:hypothetical protein DERP_002663 [Dermatophagoides pteronyssinus]|uniref:Uncharacterized protein n=1 Tax=Dermatophagoides pteronyssinus TaxID=6956 RepID=A0ABQ8JVA6_DERPT|nr:hypothetical protein DERP_002663 [Dermatophagoides pteronyssinus]
MCGAKSIVTFLFNKRLISSATGRNEYFVLRKPSGRPRWLINTTALAPFSKAYLIVGSAATIR